jgi:hypothetical protein
MKRNILTFNCDKPRCHSIIAIWGTTEADCKKLFYKLKIFVMAYCSWTDMEFLTMLEYSNLMYCQVFGPQPWANEHFDSLRKGHQRSSKVGLMAGHTCPVNEELTFYEPNVTADSYDATTTNLQRSAVRSGGKRFSLIHHFLVWMFFL